jgi:hypothetical protein
MAGSKALLLSESSSKGNALTQCQLDESEPALKKLKADPPLEKKNFDGSKKYALLQPNFSCTPKVARYQFGE